MIESVIQDNRMLALLHEGVTDRVGLHESLMSKLSNYADQYLAGLRMDPKDIASVYVDYLSSYRRNCLRFRQTGRYPATSGERPPPMARADYDIILLLSPLLTWHRYRIMQVLAETAERSERSLFVGVGPGIEMHLTREKLKIVDAYDTQIGDTLRALLPDVNLYERQFTGSEKERYDQVFLIEILEHLDAPFPLLLACRNVMQKGARLHLTTATNMPQFDHLYNFPEDHSEFEVWLRAHGFTVDYRETIVHDNQPNNIGSKNEYYVVSAV